MGSEPGRVEPSPAQHWSEFCDRLKAAGNAILDKRPDLSDRDRTDGLRFLSRVLADGILSQTGPPSPEEPFMHRFIDATNSWGIPNVDNTYLFTRISGRSTYQLTGNARGRYFILSMATGQHPCWDYAEIGEADSGQVKCAEDGSFDVVLSAREQPGNWIRLEPESTLLMIRDYLPDWDDEPGWFYLECLDDSPIDTPIDTAPDSPPGRLERVGAHFEAVGELWSRYPDMWRGQPPNTFGEPMRVPGGSSGLLGYSVGSAHLDEGESMIVELTPPADRYWVVHLYSRWGLPLDPAVTVSTLNSRQARPDSDGVVRIVVGASDPGVANWLDNQGYPEVSIWYRLSPWDGMAAPTATVVDDADVRENLPLAATVTPDGRRAQIAARRRGMARRFQR